MSAGRGFPAGALLAPRRPHVKINSEGFTGVMLRHPSLRPLSRQHHHALALCVLILRGLRGAQTDVAGLARRACRDFDGEIRGHFDAEERVLFPAVLSGLGPLPLIGRLLEEHRELRRLASALAEAPGAELLGEFAGLLRSHVRLEENELFELIQKQMSSEALARLGEELGGLPGAACGAKGTT